MSERISLTVEERTQLHLLSYSRFLNHWEVPFHLTQEGIAESIGIARCNVSRAMKKILQKGLVQERTAHVKGVARKRKVYFLTHDGELMANDLKDNVGSTRLRVQTPDGTTRQMPMLEVGAEFDNRPTLLEILRHTTPDNQLDLRNLRSDVDKGVVDFTDGAPAVRTFFGREKELEELGSLLDTRRGIFVYGLAGIGKSTLVSHLVDGDRGKLNLFWYRFHDWTTPRNLLGSLGEFLQAMGHPELKDKVESAIKLEPSDYNRLLITSLKDVEALMVFDDAQRGRQDVLDIFRNLLEPKPGLEGAKFIIISREMLPLYDRSLVNVHSVVGEMWLEGLDRTSARKLLENRMTKVENFNRIYSLTEGHPLIMELVSSAGDVTRSKGDIKRYIHEQIFTALTDAEKTLMHAASIYRYPAPADILMGVEGVSHETLDRLVDRAFVQSDAAGYLVHDLIRDFFYERLIPAERRELHRTAAKFYDSESKKAMLAEEQKEVAGPSYDIGGSFELLCVEAMHHFISAGDVKRAAQLAIDHGNTLINKGYLDEFGRTLERMGTSPLDPTEWAEISMLKGDIAENNGKWDEALAFFAAPLRFEMGVSDWPDVPIPGFGIDGGGGTVQLAEDMEKDGGAPSGVGAGAEGIQGDDELGAEDEEENVPLMLGIAKAHRRIGQLKKDQGLWSEAMTHFEKALNITEEFGDLMGTAECQRGLGLIHWRMGEYNTALAFLNKSMRTTRKTEDLGALASTSMDIGNVYKDQGEWGQAIEYYYRALGILEGLSHLTEMTRAYINLGAAYVHMEDYKRASEYFAKCVEVAEKMGHRKRLSWGLFNLAEALAKMGKLTRARELVDRSMEIAESMDDQAAMAYNHRVLGIIHARRQSWDLSEREFDESVRIQKKYKMIYHQAETQLEFGLMLGAKGDTGRAIRRLRQGLALFKQLNNKAYIDRTEALLTEYGDAE